MIKNWIIGLILLLTVSFTAGQDVVIVSSMPKVTEKEAIGIFSFKEFMFEDGSKVKMFVLPRDHRTTRNFASQMGMTSARFHEKAENAFSSGKLNLLVVLDNDREVIRFVSKTDGAIGYVQDYFIFNNSGLASVIRFR